VPLLVPQSARPLLRALVSLPSRSVKLNLIPLLLNTLLLCWSLDLLYTVRPVGCLSFCCAECKLTLAPSRPGLRLSSALVLLCLRGPDLRAVGRILRCCTNPGVRKSDKLPARPASVGAVGPEMVKLTIRVPSTKPTSDPIQVSYQPMLLAEADPTYSASFVTTAVDDYVKTITLDNLSPGVAYRYVIPAIGVGGSFTTAPDPVLARSTGSHFAFLSTSCIKPVCRSLPTLFWRVWTDRGLLALAELPVLAPALARRLFEHVAPRDPRL
jgi:hypothetical protein